MAIALTFGPYKKSLENLEGPYQTLVLEGTNLVTDDGLVIAELVSDESGRFFWQRFDGKNSMHPAINLYGMGRP